MKAEKTGLPEPLTAAVNLCFLGVEKDRGQILYLELVNEWTQQGADQNTRSIKPDNRLSSRAGETKKYTESG